MAEAAGRRRKKLTALLDAQAGVEYEGEEPPQPADADRLAIRAYNLLATGAGGIDLAGIAVVVEYLGIADVEDLLHRLEVIRNHKPPERPEVKD